MHIPRIHNLIDLLGTVLPHYPSLRTIRRGAYFLSDFAVETRYPGVNTTKRQAVAALRWTDRVRTLVRGLLNIRPPRHRKKN